MTHLALVTLAVLGPADPIDRAAADALAAWGVPGVGVVVVRAGLPDVVRGYGRKAIGTDAVITPETVFPLASCTKAVTATLLAKLADDGVLGWDDPVRKHLPVFRLADPHADALVTLRDLMCHRTGVGGHDMLWYRAPWDRDETLRRLTKLAAEKLFRDSYQYSTLMVMAAGTAAATRAALPWDELVRAKLFDPLGMAGVTFTTADPAFRAADRATGHRLGPDGKPRPTPLYETNEPNPAGSVNLPLKSMVPWLKLHLGNGEVDGKRVVSASNLGETRTPHTVIRMDANLRRQHPDTVQLAYGMGWLTYDYRGKRTLAHGGMIDGFRVHVQVMPDDGVAVSLFNNLHDTKMNQALANTLVDQAVGLPAKDWNAILLAAAAAEKSERQAAEDERRKARKADVPPNLPLGKYAGTFEDAAYGTLKVTEADGKLSLAWSSFRVPLDHWEADTFRGDVGFLADQLAEFRATPAGVDAVRFLGVVFTKSPR